MAFYCLTCIFLIATVQVFTTDALCPSSTQQATDTAQSWMSSNYPEPYDGDTACAFLINTNAAGEVIHINSVDMDLFGDTNNCGDNLKFYDGASDTATLLATACGRDIVTVQSTSQNLYVKFTSDAFREAKGFSLKYWSAPSYNTVCMAGAANINVGMNPVLIPISTADSMKCQYKLTALTADSIVVVHLYGWDEPEGLMCDAGGIIQVYNGDMSGEKMLDTCGADHPFGAIGSKGQNMVIKFSTTRTADSKKFYIKANSMSKTVGSCNDISGMFIGPTSSFFWYPLFKTSTMYCQKTLLSPGTTVRTTVMTHTACADYIPPFKAMEGTTDLAKKCDGDMPPVYRSSGMDMTLIPIGSTPVAVLLKAASFESHCNRGATEMMMSSATSMKKMTLDDIQRNSYCMRTLKSENANYMVIVHLESSLDDNEDCVSFYDGPTSSNTLLKRLCGGFEKTMVASSGQYLTFSVMTNDKKTAGEIELSYWSVLKGGMCETQNILVKREKTNLTSPNFPMEYPLNAMCSWRFVSYRPDFVVVIEVVESDLPEDCTDVGFVNDGETHEQMKLGEWCGDRKPSYRGTGQTLLLTFKADHMSMAGKKGFKFTYYADNKVHRELEPGTDVLTIAAVLTIIVVFFGLVFIIVRLCQRSRAKKASRKSDCRPITE